MEIVTNKVKLKPQQRRQNEKVEQKTARKVQKNIQVGERLFFC